MSLLKFIFKFRYHISVFITGAAILIIEIAATRILSPFFGNTIFSFSSIIGVILAALSFGYWRGGVMADKHPKDSIFFGIILSSGFLVLISQFLSFFILPAISLVSSIIYGPLISAFILFFIPAFLLGTLSPFAIKLTNISFIDKGVGRISGEIFFWSTFGSILGTIAAGFYLIPNFGVQEIVMGVGAVLIILGSAGIIIQKGSKNDIISKIIVAVIFILTNTFVLHTIDSRTEVIYNKDGLYESLKVIDSESDGRPARFLFQDRNAGSGIFLDSTNFAFDYTKYSTIYPAFNVDLKRALILGGGAYTIPRQLLSDNKSVYIDVIEIEPLLYKIAQDYFFLDKSPRLSNTIMDGRRFLTENKTLYDLILSDVYLSYISIPQHFTTVEFFESAKEDLNENGIMIVNVIGNLKDNNPSFVLSEIKTFKEVFPNSYFFAIKDRDDKELLQNFIFIGHNSEDIIDFTAPHILNHTNETIQNLKNTLLDITKFNFSDDIIFTDNYSPIEYLIASTIYDTPKIKSARYQAEIIVNGNIFEYEIADTPALRTIGLSGRKILTPHTGLLFVYDKPGVYKFWMKEMNFPIDIIWIDEKFKVIDIHKNISPDTYPETFSSISAAQYVFEINAGETNSLNIEIGDTVNFEL